MLKYLGRIFKNIKNKYKNICDEGFELRDESVIEARKEEIENLRNEIYTALSAKVKDKKEYSEEFVREYYENLPEEYDYNGFGKYYKDMKDA